MMKTSSAGILLPSGIHLSPCIAGILRHESFIPRGIERVSSVKLRREVKIAHSAASRKQWEKGRETMSPSFLGGVIGGTG